MKLSEQWLREWCDPEADITALADVLTIGGLEVDAVDPLARPESVVVAEVIDVAKHPNADRLSLCRVSDGTEERQVVCGAPNVQAGMKTAYAPVGCVLPGGQKLKRAKIRGVESHGMLCSAAELALRDTRQLEVSTDGTHMDMFGTQMDICRKIGIFDDIESQSFLVCAEKTSCAKLETRKAVEPSLVTLAK